MLLSKSFSKMVHSLKLRDSTTYGLLYQSSSIWSSHIDSSSLAELRLISQEFGTFVYFTCAGSDKCL